MSAEIKFTEEEMKELEQIRSEYANKINIFGQIYLQKTNLQRQADELNKIEKEAQQEYYDIQKKEEEFLNKITEKYGEGSLNPETGIFSPANK